MTHGPEFGAERLSHDNCLETLLPGFFVVVCLLKRREVRYKQIRRFCIRIPQRKADGNDEILVEKGLDLLLLKPFDDFY